MKIPKSFKIFGTTVKVVFKSKLIDNDREIIGLAENIKAKISLSMTWKGEVMTDSSIMDTFYHEKVHMILDAMGENKLSSNEKFVEILSRLLRQSDETAKY